VSGVFLIERLSPAHDREAFSCGVAPLDIYLRQQVGQDVRRGLANCFVAVHGQTNSIAGYYTLSATGISLTNFPPEIARRLPYYPTVPAALVGRLAVDKRFRAQRLGEALIRDAVDRAANSDPAAFALVVDAKDDHAAAFYRHYEFQPLSDRPIRLFLPLRPFRKAPLR
jgi:ribosomal protein S18 acetylase RimI-like enzyme